MIIEDIEESKIIFWKEILNNLKRFIAFSIAALAISLVSSIILFFVEECYFHVPEQCPADYQQSFELCQNVGTMNQTTFVNDTEAFELYINVTKFCHNRECKIDKYSQKSCTIDHKKFFKWMTFMLTTTFTIGYGNIVPKSTPGRGLTILIAIIGIPMASATVLFFGKAINNTIKYLIVCFENTCLKHEKIVWFKRKFALIHFLLTFTTVGTQALFYKFTAMSHYSYFDLIYFTCISMLTIGFGDITPNLQYYYQLDILMLVLITTVELVFFFWSFSLIGSFIDFLTSFESDFASQQNHHHQKKRENNVVDVPDENLKCHVEINRNTLDDKAPNIV
ncbi:TWiK family of potassium channels protein 7-like [Clytia hemisphaerica]|uniref:Potassium channel domain-containing protein n=1 Tax=Clytia hemisphaerica TaxID=252671 RepID=A0A7M5UWP3_9CNID